MAQETKLGAVVTELSDEEKAELEGAGNPELHSEGRRIGSLEEAATQVQASKAQRIPGLPDWARVPPDFEGPKGRTVYVLRLLGDYCEHPDRGDRQVMLWGLTSRDEQQARKRAAGESSRYLEEMAKQMIRYVDDVKITWLDPVFVDSFWDEIGPKHRGIILAWYLKTHQFSEEERVGFLARCVASATAT